MPDAPIDRKVEGQHQDSEDDLNVSREARRVDDGQDVMLQETASISVRVPVAAKCVLEGRQRTDPAE